jgi:hypothetical protein
VRAGLALPRDAAPLAVGVLGRWCGGEVDEGEGTKDGDAAKPAKPAAKKGKKAAVTTAAPPASDDAGAARALAAAALRAGLGAGGGGKGATVGAVWVVKE